MNESDKKRFRRVIFPKGASPAEVAEFINAAHAAAPTGGAGPEGGSGPGGAGKPPSGEAQSGNPLIRDVTDRFLGTGIIITGASEGGPPKVSS